MKIRSGFVSNSSSASFIIIVKDLKIIETLNDFDDAEWGNMPCDNFYKFVGTDVSWAGEILYDWMHKNPDKSIKLNDLWQVSIDYNDEARSDILDDAETEGLIEILYRD